MLDLVNPGAIVVTLFALGILILWDQPFMKKHKVFQLVQGPLVAVVSGILLNILFKAFAPELSIDNTHLVQIPEAEGFIGFLGLFTLPDFSAISNPIVYTTAFTIAIVASLETLLCVEATDKLDPMKRITPTNLELKAQGIGNIISGFIGGLPITQVIVRSSANIQSGGKSKMSAILHGFLLLFAAMMIPGILNMIPLATLAAILFVVGYKLAKPVLFRQMYRLGWVQFIPFMVTILGIVFTDLLVGIAMGMGVAIFYILRQNFRNPYFVPENIEQHPEDIITIKLSEDVSFLNRASIMKTLNEIPPKTQVIIDASNTTSIDHDVYEIIRDFESTAEHNQISIKMIGLKRSEKGRATFVQVNDAEKKIQQIIKDKKRQIEVEPAQLN
jgi:MFS superfamily sulfate permease-like transporter